ncbi:hypothetical protein BKA64DRAFT_728256 [Cadophora sp. MPI-SDFR-AT-0126]|nr:hypothetical protein BKA64DRAFT_728256 [Leotiomycetes sp. MPI-SDFR-AT-0126]
MALSTFSIKYHVFLGDPRLLNVEGATSSFIFDEQAPASLCGDYPKNGDPEKSEYKDTLSRFIHTLGVSHTKEILLTRQFKSHFKVENAGPEGCRTCGTTKGDLKPCAGCKSIRYCSKQCQIKNWGYHKSVCKIIRMERAMHDATGGVPMEKQSIDEMDRAMQAAREAGGITSKYKPLREIERDLQAMTPPGMKLKMMTAHEAAAAGFHVNKAGSAEATGTKTTGQNTEM